MKQIKKFLQYTSGTCTMSKLSGKKKKNPTFFRYHHNLGFCAIWGSTKLRHARLEA